MACEEERLSGPGAAVNSVLKTGVNFMVTAHWSPVYRDPALAALAVCFPPVLSP